MITSIDTYSVPGRGTVKAVRVDRETRGRLMKALNARAPVAIDGEQWIIDCIEEQSHAAAMRDLCLVVRSPPEHFPPAAPAAAEAP